MQQKAEKEKLLSQYNSVMTLIYEIENAMQKYSPDRGLKFDYQESTKLLFKLRTEINNSLQKI